MLNFQVIPLPRHRSDRWISTSVVLGSSAGPETSLSCSSEYFCTNLVSPVLFYEALQEIPNNAIVIEIGPHSLLQSVMKKVLHSECSVIGMMKRNKDENESTEYILRNIGW